MKLIPWDRFKEEIEAYTVTKAYGDMSYNNEDKSLILNNRKMLAKDLNTTLDKMVAPNQVHSATYKEVSLLDGGKGMYSKDDCIQETDALYTSDTDLTLLSFHADCTPVLLYCRDKKIVCSIHAGWSGTMKQIVSKTVQHLIKEKQCNPKHIYAYIGPCISKDVFEVQQDVIDKVLQLPFDTTSFYTKTDETHYLLDNKALNKAQLLYHNVPLENIDVSPYCTIKNNDLFYSHRKQEPGRSITIIKKII